MRAALNREIDKTIELNRVHITRTLDKVAASLAVDKTPAIYAWLSERRSNERTY